MTPTAARDRRSTWKVAVVAAIAVLLVGAVLPGSARADGMSDRDDLAAAIDSLSHAGLDADALGHFDKAVEKLLKALDDDELWTADGAPGPKGSKIFKEGAKAVKELVKADRPGEAAGLVDYFAGLADDAMAAGGGEKAAKKYAKALEALDKGKLDKAVKEFGKAWKYAIKEAGSPLATGIVADVDGWLGFDFDLDPGLEGFTGSGYVYSFQMITADYGAAMVVSGWSESNEGFLASPFFSAGDTASGTPGQMQVHVSCSDAFAGGIGEKSDPTSNSQWLVDYARIAKYKDGVIDKSCLLVGADSGYQGGSGVIG